MFGNAVVLQDPSLISDAAARKKAVAYNAIIARVRLLRPALLKRRLIHL